MPKRHIDLLIEELGNELGFPGMRLDDEGACAISTENGLEMVLNYVEDEEGDFLVTYADLGRIPEKTREEVCAALLKGNFGWQNTRGTTLSTTAGGRRAVLQSHARVDQLDLATLSETLDHFARWAALWVEIIRDIDTGASDAARPLDPSALA